MLNKLVACDVLLLPLFPLLLPGVRVRQHPSPTVMGTVVVRPFSAVDVEVESWGQSGSQTIGEFGCGAASWWDRLVPVLRARAVWMEMLTCSCWRGGWCKKWRCCLGDGGREDEGNS
jgi:hypothetical protein